mgnify:CR=1 FL=1
MDDSSEFKGYEASILADRLSLFSLGLLILYIAAAVAGLLPPAFLNTAWQLKAIRTILDSAFLPLLALGLLHLAAYLDPQNLVLQNRRKLAARLAILAVLGFLLFIPLQVTAAWRTVAAANANASRQLARANETFNILRDIIVQAPTLEDLQQRLDNQQNRGVRLNLEEKGVSLEQTKQELLEQLVVVRDAVIARVSKPDRQETEALARETVRVVISSLALALAFSAGAQRKGSTVPLLVEWHTMLSLRSPRAALAEAADASELAYLSRLAPNDEDGSAASAPPPP